MQPISPLGEDVQLTTLIKLFYAGCVAALLVLCVAFGTRTFYAAPHPPEYPQSASIPRPGPAPLTPEEQRLLAEAQQQYQDSYQRYEARRITYRRYVFLIAAVAGVAAVAAGAVLPPRVDAIRLGLVAGGLGCVIYAVVQAGGDLGRMTPTLMFAAALIGLVLVLAAGYRWLLKLPDAG
jgi:lipopolysaccharide export LptBFGC system permease protein LptF